MNRDFLFIFIFLFIFVVIEKLNALITSKKRRQLLYFSEEKYSRMLSEVISTKSKCSTPLNYRRLKHCDDLKINKEAKLIVSLKPGKMYIQCSVTNVELFSTLFKTHTIIGHAGRTRMLKDLQVIYI